jgi:WhiB family transcriptional regulator, redox-sensing transcriptional regulator
MPEDWRRHAVCRDHDPEIWFPVGNGELARRGILRAKAICAGCPVSGECLSWALASGEDSGVWGGLSEDERRVMSRARVPKRRSA